MVFGYPDLDIIEDGNSFVIRSSRSRDEKKDRA